MTIKHPDDNEMNESKDKEQSELKNDFNMEGVHIKKDDSLSVRIRSEFKNKFDTLKDDLNISKKQLIETLIHSYIENNKKDERDTIIEFDSEIHLISNHFDNIMNILQKMVHKSQDASIIIRKDSQLEIQKLQDEVKSFESKWKKEVEQCQTFKESITELSEQNEKLLENTVVSDAKIKSFESEVKSKEQKNVELLKEINELRKIEKENFTFQDKMFKLSELLKEKEKQLTKEALKIERLENDILSLNDSIQKNHQDKQLDIEKLTQTLYREKELEIKEQALLYKEKIYTLQTENFSYVKQFQESQMNAREDVKKS